MSVREHLLPLPDGRQLTGTSSGPEGGRPVLFVAGAATGKTMRFGLDALGVLGVRLITMDRPGMEGSSDHIMRDVWSTAQDYQSFVNYVLGEDRPVPVVANSQGGIFGVAAAATGWASRLVLVSPADEVADPRIRGLLAPHAAALAELVETDPAEAASLFASFGPREMEQMILESASDEDRRVYSSRDFVDMYRRALEEGFANDGAGYVRDTLLAMGRWDLPLGAIKRPVDILVGAKDLGHSPDQSETLASRIPTANRKLIAGAGGALLWTHAEMVLRHALAD